MFKSMLSWQAVCLLIVTSSLVSACQPKTEQTTASASSVNSTHHNANSVASRTASDVPVNLASAAASQVPTASTSMTATIKPTPQNPKAIDWTAIDSGIPAVDPAQFSYPFALNSQPVLAYADMYKVDKITARYNLTIGMAVNEVLDKVLDQIGTAYVSHELTAGKNSEFIIHTTKAINPSSHRYIFAEPFAKGLSINVRILNDGVKPQR